MKQFNLAIEKGKRYFENEIISFYFVATEFIFNKEKIVSGNYKFIFSTDDKAFFQQNLIIDVEKRKVVVENSHEDPLIESEDYFFICGQLTSDIINKKYEHIECAFYINNTLLRKTTLMHNQLQELFLIKKWNSEVSNYTITTLKACTVRVHLGKNDASYYEEEYQLNKNEIFDFKKYLSQHEYVAVQCSYEDGVDIEEKHVFKGIKGIYNSQYYKDNYEEYVPIFPFSKKYTITQEEGWENIQNINQLILYYQHNKQEVKKVFEMDENFIIPFYKKYKTSSIGKLYSQVTSRRYHIDSNFCFKCDRKSECMQLVPSGLSEMLLKKNIMVESFKNCSIYKLMKE